MISQIFILIGFSSIAFITKFIKNNKNKSIVFFLYFLSLASFRSFTVGTDTPVYVKLYESLNHASVSSLLRFFSRYEIGYLLLNRFLLFISDNPRILIITTSFIIYFSINYFITKYSPIIGLSWYIFFTFEYFSSSINTIRLFLALGILLFSIKFIVNRNFFLFIFIVILATLFHRTAMFFILVYPLFSMKITYFKLLTLIFAASIINIYFENLFLITLRFFPIYSYFIESTYLYNGLSIFIAIRILINFVIISFIYFDKEDLKKNINIELVNIRSIYLALLVFSLFLNIFSISFSILTRVSDYAMISMIAAIPSLLLSKKNKRMYPLFALSLILIFLSYTLTISILRPEWNSVYPFNLFND